MRLTETPGYIEKLNREEFAGYNDWRLPTIDELKSLLSSEKQATAAAMYISPIFDQEQYWCWTSGEDEAWSVNFQEGKTYWLNGQYYVRAVRSVK